MAGSVTHRKHTAPPAPKGNKRALGNKGGRPTNAARQAWLRHRPEARALIVKQLRSEDERIAQNAAQFIIERAEGKVPQAIGGEEGGPIWVVVE